MILINNVDCGVSRKGTGVGECEQALGKPSGFILCDTTWTADVTTDTINLAYVNTQILLGNFVPFLNAVDFADNSEDTVYETFSSGRKSPVRDGLPEFDFTYNNSYPWHTAAYSHNGNSEKAIILVWENGVMGFDTSVDGNTIRGLRRSYQQTKTFQNNDGSVVSKTMISIQLADAIGYNQNMSLLNEASLGFSIDDIKGSIDCRLVVTSATPVATDTTISVSVTSSGNRATNILGLAAANFVVQGAVASAATYNTVTKAYDLTITALVAGSTNVALGSLTESAVELSGVIYSGATPSFSVA